MKSFLQFHSGIALLLLFFSQPLFAQNDNKKAVNGFVRDSTGTGISGVTVLEKGTRNATSTGNDGSFTLNVGNNAVLVFSSVGFLRSEVAVGDQTTIAMLLKADKSDLGEVVVIGYGARRKESLTGAISTVTSKDLDRVHAGATVSAGLAGKIPGVTFRMPDGRPGASANIQIRNMGNPLYVIDGIQQDAGQFNNIAPNDIESITVLKDASAAIYGVRAANGVVVVTTKRGRMGTPSVNFDGFYGMQNWVRFPRVTTNSYDYMLYKQEAELNWTGTTSITDEMLQKYKEGTEFGYQSFNWRDFILEPDAPLVSASGNLTGGTENIKYYVSATHLHQNSVLGREYRFDRSNFQANVETKVSKRIRAAVQINGRLETRTNPGVPGGDDYWLPRFAVLRNLPTERPYANDNPDYLNTIGQNDANWGFINYKHAGKYFNEWRVVQTNGELEYQIPGIKGLSIKGVYSYYIADNLYNNQEYTYKTYTYRPNTDTYDHTGGSINPWREKEQIKQINTTTQLQLTYNANFGDHNIGAVVVNERYTTQRRRNWVRSIPASNALPLVYYAQLADYNDQEQRGARIGYIGRFNYNYDNRYYFEVAGRRDASHLFKPDKRWGFFPAASVGWRLSRERFMTNFLGGKLDELKLRASYGTLGDDGVDLPPFSYVEGYTYGNNGVSIIGGQPVVVSRDRGVPILNVTWFKSTITDVGADFSLAGGKITGSLDWFYRKRTGLRGPNLPILLPVELGYEPPPGNAESDATYGQEFMLAYNGKLGREFNFTVSANVGYARTKFLSRFNPRYNNSWDKYRNGREDRYTQIAWGFEIDGQFTSHEQINNHPVNIDGQGNRTLLPGDLIYKDQNGDNKIDGLDERPIGYGGGKQPNLNYGLSIGFTYKQFDFNADFSGAAGYTWFQNWETRWPFQNGGNFNTIFEDRWRRADPFDPASEWLPGKYPALRFNPRDHSNYTRTSTFWAHNVKYLRARTIQLGYTLPENIVNRFEIRKLRVYVNAYNLFSIDNLRQFDMEPEVNDDNGLQFPQMRNINFGINLTF
jgi:TonB-linked SusC/RagA family outer membrane protein